MRAAVPGARGVAANSVWDAANRPGFLPHHLTMRGHAVLAGRGRGGHAFRMFAMTEPDAVAIRAAFEHWGESSAPIGLRRRFPGITDSAKARACVRTHCQADAATSAGDCGGAAVSRQGG